MPVNIFITFIFGSALAWLLIKITRTPRHLQGVVIGCCSAGGNSMYDFGTGGKPSERCFPVLILSFSMLAFGLKGSNASVSVVVGILAVRSMFLPLLGIVVVKVANRFGMVGSDTLYQFVLMLQYAVPPATAVGTITQFFQLGQSESSVIMLWSYATASFSLTL
ncbi:Membrane transport protein - like 10, partial [Theobroma cacao]